MRFENDGVGLNVLVDGPDDGVPVVFLHGVAASTKSYDWLPPEITAGRRIIRVDFRGHGESDRAPGSYDIDHYGGDVAALLRDVAGRPAVLVGHSLGGAVAWWVAQRHPELVAAALLEDPPLYLGEPAEHESNEIVKLFPLLRDRAIAWQREGVDLDRAAATIAGDPAGPDPSVRIGDVVFDEAVRAQADGQLRMDPEVLTATADGSTLAATDTTAPVTAPVLILAADDALIPAFPSAHAQRLARTHPGVEVVRIPGAGHLIHDGRASRAVYIDSLVEFLGRYAV